MEVVVAYFNVLSWHLSAETEDNDKKLPS